MQSYSLNTYLLTYYLPCRDKFILKFRSAQIGYCDQSSVKRFYKVSTSDHTLFIWRRWNLPYAWNRPKLKLCYVIRGFTSVPNIAHLSFIKKVILQNDNFSIFLGGKFKPIANSWAYTVASFVLLSWLDTYIHDTCVPAFLQWEPEICEIGRRLLDSSYDFK